MAKWEYVLIRMSATGGIRHVYGRQVEKGVKFEDLFFELTEDGWELDQLESVRQNVDGGVLWMVLKREKQPSEK